MKNIFKTNDTSIYEIYLTGEDLKDIANIIDYFQIQQKNYKFSKKNINGMPYMSYVPPAFKKSMVHYRRLLATLDGQVDDI
jgi:hypothetical protein